MYKPTKLSMALDTHNLKEAYKLIGAMTLKLEKYNKEVTKSNMLLREQERLRDKLNITVKKGKVEGLIK